MQTKSIYQPHNHFLVIDFNFFVRLMTRGYIAESHVILKQRKNFKSIDKRTMFAKLFGKKDHSEETKTTNATSDSGTSNEQIDKHQIEKVRTNIPSF